MAGAPADVGDSVRWARRSSVLVTVEDVDRDSEDNDSKDPAGPPEHDALPAQSSTVSCPMSTKAERERQDLREFLKVIRTDWSIIPGRHGRPNIDRVLSKLQAIGVCNIFELMRRVESNSINEDLFKAGQPVFSKETIENFRKERKFLNVMEHLKDKHFRQTGLFAPVPQMLAKTNRARRDNTLFASIENPPRRRGSKDLTALSAYAVVEPKGPRSLPPMSDSESSTSAEPGSSTTDPEGSQDTDDPFGEEVEPHLRRQPLRFLSVAGAGSRPHTASLRGGRSRSQPHSCASKAGRPNTAPEPMTLHQRRRSSAAAPDDKRITAWDASSQATQDVQPEEGHSCTRRRKSQSGGPVFVGPEGRNLRMCQDEGTIDATAEDLMAEDALLVALGQRLQMAAIPMQTGDRPALWAALHGDSLVKHGDSMLYEQQALDDKTRLLHVMSQEGDVSATRRSITSNIYSRLLEEEQRKCRAGLDTHTDCASIKDSLTHMQQSRREFQSLRAEVESVLLPRYSSEDRHLLRNFVRGSADFSEGLVANASSCSDDSSEISEPAHQTAFRRAQTLGPNAFGRRKTFAGGGDPLPSVDATATRKSVAVSPSAVAERKSLPAASPARRSSGARRSLSRA